MPYERHRHEVVAAADEAGVWQARNPGQQWRTRFDSDGFLVEPADGEWTWGLALSAYGTGEALRGVDTLPRVGVDGQRVTYRRGDQLDEWFINDRRGLEHGFTLHARPAGGAGPVVFDLIVRGPLKPHVASDGRGVTFAAMDGTVRSRGDSRSARCNGRRPSGARHPREIGLSAVVSGLRH